MLYLEEMSTYTPYVVPWYRKNSVCNAVTGTSNPAAERIFWFQIIIDQEPPSSTLKLPTNLQIFRRMSGPPRRPCFQPPVARSSQEKPPEWGQPGWLEVRLWSNINSSVTLIIFLQALAKDLKWKAKRWGRRVACLDGQGYRGGIAT